MSEDKRAYLRAYYERNREKLKARSNARYHGLSDEQRDALRTSNRLRVRNARRSDPEAYSARQMQRRAEEAGVADEVVTPAARAALVRFYGGLCVRCDGSLVGKWNCHLDHVVPLAKGGRHALSNLQPLCHSCNSRKHVDAIDYRPQAVGWFAYQGGAA